MFYIIIQLPGVVGLGLGGSLVITRHMWPHGQKWESPGCMINTIYHMATELITPNSHSQQMPYTCMEAVVQTWCTKILETLLQILIFLFLFPLPFLFSFSIL